MLATGMIKSLIKIILIRIYTNAQMENENLKI